MTEPVLPPLPKDLNQVETADQEHLKLLTIFHYVVGGLECLGCCFGSIYILMGAIISAAPAKHGEPPPAVFGAIMIIFGIIFAVLPLALGICTIISGKRLKERRTRLFSMVVAGINCMLMPFGTALGVFTLIVLTRESVKKLYEGRR